MFEIFLRNLWMFGIWISIFVLSAIHLSYPYILLSGQIESHEYVVGSNSIKNWRTLVSDIIWIRIFVIWRTCVDECGGMYYQDSDIDDFVYRYYFLGDPSDGLDCDNPGAYPGEEFFPHSPNCLWLLSRGHYLLKICRLHRHSHRWVIYIFWNC